MPDPGSTQRQDFTVMAIGQAGRLQYEAILLAGSLRLTNPGFSGRLVICEPQPGPLWQTDPRMSVGAREVLKGLGATILPFESQVFGQAYPYGNKIEALAALPEAPFLFLDTDTLITGDLATVVFDFIRPAASMRREGTWPKIELYGPGYSAIWKSLYDRFGLDFASSLDRSQPDDYWQRYLYFNAGWFFHASPRRFGARFLTYAKSIRDDPPPELVLQELDPWLDQVALPLVIHSLGGGRPGVGHAGLDGDVTCHYRTLPLLYARESDRAVEVLEAVAKDPPLRRVLRDHPPVKAMVLQNQGRRARALFDRANLPQREQVIRNTLKREGLWLR
ncbi:MAG: hypothetical protein Q7J44_14605 [Pseudotabrizicola sp.]|uniref:hypothetical protein n=1 Tax=Pseudotabrizicola sp. TaxID=2939647 RepID=UPI0027217876|nr:hypothetical protein [Pseudotabrizicola sp.]MDO9639767.1 hypothetical protein [Pseudotabrizicola sp.]